MHDFEAQRRETFSTFEALSAQFPIPERIDLDIHLFGCGGADCDAAANALERGGFRADVDRETASIEVTVSLDCPSAELIWQVERRVTELLLPHGFEPDGWGFALPPQGGLLRELTSQAGRILRLS